MIKILKKFKEDVNKATKFIESCWDENNQQDGKTFDQRITERLNELEDDVREIVINSMG